MKNKINMPKIGTYGNYSSGNYGVHAMRVDLGNLSVWFSYQTPIAFQFDGQPRVVRQNDWATTTGKHLNAIDGGSRDAKKARVTGEEFERLYLAHIGG